MNKFLNKIQGQPYEDRIRILWGVVAVVALVLVVMIFSNIKETIGNAGGSFTKIEAAKFIPDSPISYMSVERVEQTDKTLKIYFNINNSGNDILNVPKLSDISLSVSNNLSHPQKITDRQGNTFVQKVLSRTQNFGILFFPAINGNRGTLLFDQMSLEKSRRFFKQPKSSKL